MWYLCDLVLTLLCRLRNVVWHRSILLQLSAAAVNDIKTKWVKDSKKNIVADEAVRALYGAVNSELENLRRVLMGDRAYLYE